MKRTESATTSITGENSTIRIAEPTMSENRLINLLKPPLSGTCLILITGSPCKSSVYGLVGITLLYTTEIGKTLMGMIREDEFLTLLYEHNYIMKLITVFR